MRCRRIALGLLVVAVAAGCMRSPKVTRPTVVFDEVTFAARPATVFRVQLDDHGKPVTTVIGTPKEWQVRKEDTLLDVARYFGLGYGEITQANPGLDAWVPTPDAKAVVPTQWTLPCCTYQGLVVNVAEMRLFYYRRDPAHPKELWVFTAPVGVGEPEHPTPRGVYKVRAKTENPTWVIPESILREHIRERGDHRRAIKGGDDDNPLGRYRLSLTSKAAYAIHGTNIPWGPGMPVSHGCIRLYPEDIEKLYPLVPVGTRVELTYQPVRIGRRNGAFYVQASPDVYKRVKSLGDEAVRAAARHPELRKVNRHAIRAAAERSQGLPVALSSGDVGGVAGADGPEIAAAPQGRVAR
jgi:L,D-transpeptidase ErfK/SrfK